MKGGVHYGGKLVRQYIIYILYMHACMHTYINDILYIHIYYILCIIIYICIYNISCCMYIGMCMRPLAIHQQLKASYTFKASYTCSMYIGMRRRCLLWRETCTSSFSSTQRAPLFSRYILHTSYLFKVYLYLFLRYT